MKGDRNFVSAYGTSNLRLVRADKREWLRDACGIELTDAPVFHGRPDLVAAPEPGVEPLRDLSRVLKIDPWREEQ